MILWRLTRNTLITFQLVRNFRALCRTPKKTLSCEIFNPRNSSMVFSNLYGFLRLSAHHCSRTHIYSHAYSTHSYIKHFDETKKQKQKNKSLKFNFHIFQFERFIFWLFEHEKKRTKNERRTHTSCCYRILLL